MRQKIVVILFLAAVAVLSIAAAVTPTIWLTIQSGTTQPGTPTVGTVFFDTDLGTSGSLCVFDGTEWLYFSPDGEI